MALQRITAPATEPITVEELKTWIRELATAQDSVIEGLIAEARDVVESELNRSLITQTWEKTLDKFPESIELAYPPIIAVASIQYLEETAGAPTTLSAASYVVDVKSEPGWIVPAYSYVWPNTFDTINAVTVTYTAGYGASPSSVPKSIKRWIALLVAHFYENREASVPDGRIAKLPFVDALIDRYRVATF